MKKIYIATLLAIAITSPLAAQKDSSVVRKEKKVVIIKKGEGKDTVEFHKEFEFFDTKKHESPEIPGVISSGMINFGFTNLMYANTYIGPFPYSNFPDINTGKSLHVGLESNWGFNLINGNLRFWTGVRYDINNYRFNNADMRLAGDKQFLTVFADTAKNSLKSKVVVNYIGIPFALGYQSNPKNEEDGFFIRAGVNAAYRVRTHSKVKLENGSKDKVFDDFSFNNFAITPFVYLGYNSVGFYVRYSVTPTFTEGEGPVANAWQAGLIIQ